MELSQKYNFIYATSGISPNDIPENPQDEEILWKDIQKIEEIIQKDHLKKIVAIGEIGLDYYWEKEEEKRNLQKKAFIKQIEGFSGFSKIFKEENAYIGKLRA